LQLQSGNVCRDPAGGFVAARVVSTTRIIEITDSRSGGDINEKAKLVKNGMHLV